MKTRAYVQRARAVAAAATADRILTATQVLFLKEGRPPTLDAVAERAGVTVQTVLRRFGSRDELFAAAVAEAGARVETARNAAPVGDIEGAIKNLVAHYDEWGDVALRLLALEAAGSEAASTTQAGRSFHHAWVDRVFGPLLAGRSEQDRALLIAATDVYTWKVLHRDLGLSLARTESALTALVQRILAPRSP